MNAKFCLLYECLAGIENRCANSQVMTFLLSVHKSLTFLLIPFPFFLSSPSHLPLLYTCFDIIYMLFWYIFMFHSAGELRKCSYDYCSWLFQWIRRIYLQLLCEHIYNSSFTLTDQWFLFGHFIWVSCDNCRRISLQRKLWRLLRH